MKKLKRPRLVTAVITIAAAALLFSGCSEESDTSDSSGSETKSAESETTEIHEDSDENNVFTFLDDRNLMSIELPPEFADVEITKQEQSFQTSAGEKSMVWHQAVGQDSLFMIGIVDVGFPPGEKEDMIQGLIYGRMNYSYNGEVISEGQTEIEDYTFVTGRYSFDQNGNTLYHEVALTHVQDWQFILQVLGVDEATLDREEVRNFFTSFAYTGPEQESTGAD